MKRMKKRLNRRTKKTAPFLMMLQKDRKTCPFIEESMQTSIETQGKNKDNSVLFGQEQTSDNKVLCQLEEKLNTYIQELPVLLFNSGKYDLNATKEFLFLYLIKHHPIKFTVKRNSNHMCLKTNSLITSGFSYEQFPKAYECKETKGFFPYKLVF